MLLSNLPHAFCLKEHFAMVWIAVHWPMTGSYWRHHDITPNLHPRKGSKRDITMLRYHFSKTLLQRKGLENLESAKIHLLQWSLSKRKLLWYHTIWVFLRITVGSIKRANGFLLKQRIIVTFDLFLLGGQWVGWLALIWFYTEGAAGDALHSQSCAWGHGGSSASRI